MAVKNVNSNLSVYNLFFSSSVTSSLLSTSLSSTQMTLEDVATISQNAQKLKDFQSYLKVNGSSITTSEEAQQLLSNFKSDSSSTGQSSSYAILSQLNVAPAQVLKLLEE